MNTWESLPAQFNVATWFVDRNVAEGRGRSPAFRYQDRVLTYDDVLDLMNRTGNALRDLGIGMEDRVFVLCLDAPEFLGAFWGAIKIGAVPIPVNTLMRGDDYLYFLQDSRAKAAVISAPLMAEAGDRPALLQMGELAERELPVHDPEVAIGQHHLAYLIYTSGSTGTPKGVMVEQAGMLNNQLSKVPYLGLTPADVIAQTASQAFDISVWQFLAGLLCGARVEIVPDAVAHDPQLLLRHVARNGVTVLECVPSMIEARDFDLVGGGTIHAVDPIPAYAGYFAGNFALPRTDIRFAIDAGSGAGGPAALARHLDRLGFGGAAIREVVEEAWEEAPAGDPD